MQNVRLYRTLQEDGYSIRTPPGAQTPHRGQSNQGPQARSGEPGPQYPDGADRGRGYEDVPGRSAAGLASASTDGRPERHLEYFGVRQLADYV